KGSPQNFPAQQVDGETIAAQLGVRLAGGAADGSGAPAGTAPPQQVVWVDVGDEVMVHLDSIAVRILDTVVLVSVDLETDQTGRTPLVVSLALSTGNDAAGLVAVTNELPQGNGLLAARWGPALQAAIWASLLGLAQDSAIPQGGVPRSFSLSGGMLTLQAGP